MHDLRKQVLLESGKTVSRKARSRQSTAPPSNGSSRNPSRAVSRKVSDDEEGNLSDDTVWSTNSIDEMLAADDSDLHSDAWRSHLEERMEQIIDRKRSSVQGREETLASYNHMLTAQYAQEIIHHKIAELVPAFLKSIKAENAEKEVVLALKALILTLITEPSDTIYQSAHQTLQRTISDSESEICKVAAIYGLGALTFYGGASDADTDEIMAQLLEISESDGNSVGAGDSAAVVTAALEQWGFLATQVDDLEDATEQAMDAFVEQLDSSDAAVQIAAGENIALLFEKSYTPLEEDEEFDSSEEESDDEDPATKDAERMVKRYNVYRREDQLKHTLAELANVSGRHMSKKDKKSLHTNFADILNTVEYPTRGPRYSNAVSAESGKRFGSRMTVRIHRTGEMKIDKWWKLHRLQALRRILQGGFVVHYEKNEVVFESLPIMISRS
jgi:hypothetical protein